jgi:hypothetical protein
MSGKKYLEFFKKENYFPSLERQDTFHRELLGRMTTTLGG